jgi:glutamate-1-semialdehyde 2,1-aminomutase
MTAIATDRLLDAYLAARPRSAALHASALRSFAAKGATHFARAAVPFRPYIERAEGARKWDVDGHEYLDYVVGHGALILGHGHPSVVEAVQAQAGRGLHYGDNHPLEVEWAALIQEMMPSAERIEFFASGQEANLMAIRLARVHTGRRKVLRLKGNYHGWADELAGPDAPGSVAEQVTVIAPNDLGALERELATREYALLFVEGGGGFLSGRIPISPEFYRALPGLTGRYGTVLLLDEVVTGFREAPGGWQSVVGISPDLTTLGKAVSGGLPSGALVGRAELFAPLDPGAEPARQVHHGGTWNAVPVTCAAGIAACRLYRDGAPQRAARVRGDRLIAMVTGLLGELGVAGRCWGRSIVHLALEAGVAAHRRLDLHLLHRGVASLRSEAFILSAAHTERDLELTVEALRASLVAMQEEGMPG